MDRPSAGPMTSYLYHENHHKINHHDDEQSKLSSIG